MKNPTITLSVAAGRDEVFSVLADLHSWPQWAPAFCRDLQADGVHWRARTPGGVDYLALLADERTGIIDLFIGPEKDELTLVPIRVVPQPHGSVVICTFLPPPGWAEELVERYVRALVDGLRELLARTAAGELSGAPQAQSPFYPNLVTERFHETWDFYSAQLGFRTVCEGDTYVHLVHPAGAQLGILRAELDGPPRELVSATSGCGFWLTLVVSDADAEHARLTAAGVEVAEGVEDKPWGHRQFVVRDPNGVLIAIAHRLRTAAEPMAALAAAS